VDPRQQRKPRRGSRNMKVYSAAEVTCIFAGLPIDSGRGDDEFVSIKKAEDTFTVKVGVDGELTRSESKNNYHTVDITVMRTSRANALLCAIYTGDVSIPGGAGIAPILVRDRQGLSVFSSAEAWITKLPDNAYAKEANTITWVLGVNNPINFIGGN
jgi:hypothetical protein